MDDLKPFFSFADYITDVSITYRPGSYEFDAGRVVRVIFRNGAVLDCPGNISDYKQLVDLMRVKTITEVSLAPKKKVDVE